MHETISEGASLLAIALLNYADDDGRFEAHPKKISAALFPLRELSCTVPVGLRELEHVAFIRLYNGIVNGQSLNLGCVVNFLRHQVVNKYRGSTLPPPPKAKSGPVTGQLPSESGNATVETFATNPPELPSSYGMTTVALPPSQEGKGREGKEGGDARAREVQALPSVEVVLPTEEEFREAGHLLGLPDWRIDDALLTCQRDHWRRRNGVAMDYRLELRAVLGYWEADGFPKERPGFGKQKHGPDGPAVQSVSWQQVEGEATP